MKEVFIFLENENYNLRSGTHLTNRNIHTVHFGTDTVTNLGPRIWKLVPDEIKNASSLLVFRSRINLGEPLIIALADSVKLFSRILVLLKSFQITNKAHDYIYPNIRYSDYGVIIVDTVITSCLDTPRQHERNL